MSFEPKILGFLCNWCSYAGADLAGVSRIQYPPNMRIIRLMCSGRVDPKFVFKALQLGLDGVIIMGCHPGDCHYLEGNYEAEIKYLMIRQFLTLINFENRIGLEWVSASEGVRFGEVVTNFINQIKEQGPSPVGGNNPDKDLLSKLNAMELAAENKRVRSLVGREREITERGNVYGEIIPKEQFQELLGKTIQEEFIRHRILLALQNESKSVKILAKELNIDSSEILEHIIALKNRGEVDFGTIQENTPLFYSMVVL